MTMSDHGAPNRTVSARGKMTGVHPIDPARISNLRKRGFATLDPEKRRAICSLGGKAAHAKGTAHEWTNEEAVAAGIKGASARARKKRETKMA